MFAHVLKPEFEYSVNVVPGYGLPLAGSHIQSLITSIRDFGEEKVTNESACRACVFYMGIHKVYKGVSWPKVA